LCIFLKLYYVNSFQRTTRLPTYQGGRQPEEVAEFAKCLVYVGKLLDGQVIIVKGENK